MLQIIFWTILIYLLYRFVFGFLIPVISASQQVRARMRQMQQQMNQYDPHKQQQNTAGQSSAKAKPEARGDYIDFEEVK